MSAPEYPTGHAMGSPEAPDPTSVGGGEPRSGEGAEPLLGHFAESFGNHAPISGPEAASEMADIVRPNWWGADRYTVRDNLRLITHDDRLRYCGAHSIRTFGTVDVRLGEPAPGKKRGRVSIRGLASCGRWYTCPFCGAHLATRRRTEIEQGIAAAVEQGLVVALLTLTVRHSKRDALRPLLDGLGDGWKAVGQDKAVRRLRREIGWVGYIRVLELTIGPSGWHPHYHFLVFFDPEAATVPWEDGEVDPAVLEGLGKATLRSWKAGVKRAKLRAPNRRAYDLKVLADPRAEVPAYMTKSILGRSLSPESVERVGSIAYEMTGAMSKTGKALPSGQVLRRTNWDLIEAAADDATVLARYQLLRPGVDMAALIVDIRREATQAELATELGVDTKTGEVVTVGMVVDAVTDDIELFWELEEAFKGRAMTVWSQGLKSRFGVADVTDAEVFQDVIGLPRSGVSKIQRDQRWEALRTATATAKDEYDGAVKFCEENQIDWLDPDDPLLIVDRQFRTWMGQKGRDEANRMLDALRLQQQQAAAGQGTGHGDDERDEAVA